MYGAKVNVNKCTQLCEKFGHTAKVQRLEGTATGNQSLCSCHTGFSLLLLRISLLGDSDMYLKAHHKRTIVEVNNKGSIFKEKRQKVFCANSISVDRKETAGKKTADKNART